MTEHVYVVARAGRCNGAALTVYGDALAAIADARAVAESGGWTEPDRPMQEADRLYEAFGHGDEDWIVVSQQRVLGEVPPDRAIIVNARGGWTDMAVADAVMGQRLDRQRRS